MSDDLRDRIAAVLGRHWVSDPAGGTATESWCNCTCGLRITVPGGTRDEAWRRGAQHQAQAIIEELGLFTVDRDTGRTEVLADGSIDFVTETCIVGPWEER